MGRSKAQKVTDLVSVGELDAAVELARDTDGAHARSALQDGRLTAHRSESHALASGTSGVRRPTTACSTCRS